MMLMNSTSLDGARYCSLLTFVDQGAEVDAREFWCVDSNILANCNV
jgi:hypothetical protein